MDVLSYRQAGFYFFDIREVSYRLGGFFFWDMVGLSYRKGRFLKLVHGRYPTSSKDFILLGFGVILKIGIILLFGNWEVSYRKGVFYHSGHGVSMLLMSVKRYLLKIPELVYCKMNKVLFPNLTLIR